MSGQLLNTNIFDKPWQKSFASFSSNLNYPNTTLFESIEEVSKKHPENFAYIYEGEKVTFKNFLDDIKLCSKALKACGVNSNDIVTIIMPNCPQALVMLYALNCVGAVANMLHPITSEKEIEFFVNTSKSRIVLMLDTFVDKVTAIKINSNIEKIIVASLLDDSSEIFNNDICISWNRFLSMGCDYKGKYKAARNSTDDAVIIYSGGTTGTPKGVRLSNFSINAISVQMQEITSVAILGKAVFSGMPIFHGFGLAMTCHGVLYNGGCCYLVPKFDAARVLDDVIKYKCTVIAGVPTLFEAILNVSKDRNYDLSNVTDIFCGGDSLSSDLENRFNLFLKNNKSNVKIRAGYGLSESVAAVTIAPYKNKAGSEGVPLPDTLIKICIPGTQDEVPYGQTGEICVYGPTLMKGYTNNDEETDQALQKHSDGRLWLHTGDLGYMDEDGFLFFAQRLKRTIISSGYNVYPSEIEKTLYGHDYVEACCVIGLPDSYKGQKVKAFIKLNKDISKSEETKSILMSYLKNYIAKYALPSEIEFRDKLPTTLIGKVDYRSLENEELSKL